jgi:hypothetical protein
MKPHRIAAIACVAILSVSAASAQTILRVDASSTDPAPDGATWPKTFPQLPDAPMVSNSTTSPKTPVRNWS